MSRLLSIDPGSDAPGVVSHTGIALGEYGEDQPYTVLETWAVPGGLSGFLRWADEFTTIWPRPQAVVVEHFVKWRAEADVTPLLIEGAARTIWRHADLQPASGKNTAVSDAVLKRLGLYKDGSHHHDIREATRHALWWLKTHNHHPTLEMMYPR